MRSKGKRNIIRDSPYQNLIPEPEGQKRLVAGGMSAELTVKVVKEIVLKHKHQVRLIAQKLNGPNRYKNLWNFVYQHIQYAKDKEGQEEVRTPARIWADRITGVDCDDYTVFISSVLCVWGVPHVLRVTDYGNGWQHIYPIVPNDINDYGSRYTYTVIDCVTDSFDYEVPYTQKMDFTMATYALSGFDDDEQGLAGRAERQARRAKFQNAQKPGEFVPQERRTKVGKFLQKTVKSVNKINPAFVALRNAILVAMKLNVRQVAKKLRYAYVSANVAQSHGISIDQQNRIKKTLISLQTKFVRVGGSAQALRNAILSGKGKFGRGVSLGELGDIGEIGALPAVVAVALPLLELILKAIGNVQPNDGEDEDPEQESIDGIVGRKPKVKVKFNNTKEKQVIRLDPNVQAAIANANQAFANRPQMPSVRVNVQRVVPQAVSQLNTQPKKRVNMAKVLQVAAKTGIKAIEIAKQVQKNIDKKEAAQAAQQSQANYQYQDVEPSFEPNFTPPRAYQPTSYQPSNLPAQAIPFEDVVAEEIGPDVRYFKGPDAQPKPAPATEEKGSMWLWTIGGLVVGGLLLSGNSSKPSVSKPVSGIKTVRKNSKKKPELGFVLT